MLLKQSVNRMDSTVEQTAKKHETWASVVASSVADSSVSSRRSFDEAPTAQASQILQKSSTSTDAHRRNLDRTLDAAHKLALKNRQLFTGTIETNDHGLGNAVQPHIRKSQAMNREKIQRISLPKSIYVSRLETSITADNIVNYIGNRVPNLDASHISVRLLVKKDQDLNELSFISYRLSCTEALYDTFMSPTIWPSHVRIGEFVEQQQQRKKQLGDFISSKIHELANKSGSAEEMTEMDQHSSSSKNELGDPSLQTSK